MAKAHVWYGGASLMVILLLVGIWLLFPQNFHDIARAQDSTKPAVKWEYCELVSSSKACHYSTAKEGIDADSWKEMAKKLKVPLKDGEKVGNARLLVFDFLGGQGWELVSHGVIGDLPGLGETFTFKRRVEK